MGRGEVKLKHKIIIGGFMKKEICKRITVIRNGLGMNKQQFAEYLGITPQYLGSVESGENCLSIEKIVLLAKKTNLSTDYILLGKKNVVDERFLKATLGITQDQLDSCFSIIKEVINLTKDVG